MTIFVRSTNHSFGMLKYKSLFALILTFGFISTLIFAPNTVHAQRSIKDSTISISLIYGHYAFQIPGGDISERFGPNSMVGAGYLYKTSKNWILGAEGGFLFGGKVKNERTILSNIETTDGNIVDMEGIYANYHFYEQGFSVIAKLGKVIPLGKPNTNSGLLLGVGGGYLQHKIFIDHRDRSAPQLTGDYLKGYDELKRGPAVNVFAGYLHLDNSKLINFYVGIEYTTAFTQNARPYSFATMRYYNEKYTDTFFSLKAGWMIPVYRRAPKDFYYY